MRWPPKLETVSLSRGAVLYEQGSVVSSVYFPLSAVISLLTILEDGSSVEVATVGHEGMVGLAAYLELERAVVTAIVQFRERRSASTRGNFRRS